MTNEEIIQEMHKTITRLECENQELRAQLFGKAHHRYIKLFELLKARPMSISELAVEMDSKASIISQWLHTLRNKYQVRIAIDPEKRRYIVGDDNPFA